MIASEMKYYISDWNLREEKNSQVSFIEQSTSQDTRRHQNKDLCTPDPTASDTLDWGLRVRWGAQYLICDDVYDVRYSRT